MPVPYLRSVQHSYRNCHLCQPKHSADRYRAWFTGLAPIEQPRVVVAVMIDEPRAGTYYGGAVAAPVFSQVVQHTLRAMGVPPDRAIKPEIVVAQEEPKDGSL